MPYDPSLRFVTSDGKLVVEGRSVFELQRGRKVRMLDDDDPAAKSARQQRDAECVRMSYGSQPPAPPNR